MKWGRKEPVFRVRSVSGTLNSEFTGMVNCFFAFFSLNSTSTFTDVQAFLTSSGTTTFFSGPPPIMSCGVADGPGIPPCFGGMTRGGSLFFQDVPARTNTRSATNKRERFFIFPRSSSFLSGPSPSRNRLHNDGGEGGIRTLEAGFSHLRDFQSRSFGQLGHLSVFRLPGTSSQYGGDTPQHTTCYRSVPLV